MKVSDGIGARAISGLLWGAFGSLVSKGASFAAQVYAGWVLSKADFGLYAIALGCAAFFSGLVGGGTQRVLVQRGQDYDGLAGDVIQVAFLFNITVAVLIAAAAWPLARHFGNFMLVPLLLVMAAATIIATPGPVYSAKLSIELKFATLQQLAICSHAVRFGSLILFAHFGFHSLSFALPVLLIAFSDSYLARRAVGPIRLWKVLTSDRAWEIVRSSRWVMVGTFANAMIQNGGNIAVAWLTDPITLGVFFFAFQLTLSFASLLGGMVQQIVVSSLVRMGNDGARRTRAFSKALGIVALIGTFLGFSVALVASCTISHVWGHRWDESIGVVEILSLGIPAVMLSWVARASLEASGRWTTVTALMVMEGVLTVFGTVAGLGIGGLAYVSGALVLAQICASAIQVSIAARELNLGRKEALQALTMTGVAGLIALGIAVASTGGSVLRGDATFVEMSAALSVYAAIFLTLARVACPSSLHDVYELIAQTTRAIARSSAKRFAA